MIERFRHKGLEDFFLTGSTKGIQPTHAKKIRLILTALHQATQINHMNAPGFDLHPLKGEKTGYWAVTVNKNWRIIFAFSDGNAFDVDYLDYH